MVARRIRIQFGLGIPGHVYATGSLHGRLLVLASLVVALKRYARPFAGMQGLESPYLTFVRWESNSSLSGRGLLAAYWSCEGAKLL